jgi:tetratricopeptide (TPR) repeat protein
MNWIKVFLLATFLISVQLFIGGACQSIVQNHGMLISTVENPAEREQVEVAEKLYRDGKSKEAEEAFALFVKNKPTSFYYYRAMMGQARAVFEQKRWTEAAAIYRVVEDGARDLHVEIAGQALFELSFCYENMGDENRVLASLLDAQKLQKNLPPEIGLAEIPARIAASYHRMGQENEAGKYLQLAQKGIVQIQIGKEPTIENKKWLAEIYFHMGQFSTRQLTEDNLQAHLDTLKMIQIFTLRCVETEASPWSGLAAADLTSNYTDVLLLIMQMPISKSMDAAAAKREKLDRQMYFFGVLLAHIADLKSQRLILEKAGAEQDKLFTGLAEIEQKGQNFLLTSNALTPLTPESTQRPKKKK